MIVYMIRNKVNGKLYFGITRCSLRKRWNEHNTTTRTLMNRAIKKYGRENFSIQVVKKCKSIKEMFLLEIKLIKQFQSNNPKFGYNQSTGGENPPKGRIVSDETRRLLRQSAINAGRRPSKEAIAKSANERRGKPSHKRMSVVLNGCNVFDSLMEASSKTGMCVTAISNNAKGITKKTRLGTWVFIKKDQNENI